MKGCLLMESSRYIDEVNCYHSAGFSFDYQINWIVPAITGSENANGYIVQHFTRLSQPKNSIVDDIEYFEAWRIKNGVCLDRGKCDDEFSVGMNLGFCALQKALHTKGSFEISAAVYWIPEFSQLCKIVDKWSDTAVTQTAGLKGSYDFRELSEEYLVFHRPLFTHSWSLITEDEIKSKVQKAIFAYCPYNTPRDEELMNGNLEYIFEGQSGELQKIKRRIANAWHQQWA